MRWQSSVTNKLPALKWIGLPIGASLPVFVLFFAALLSTVPFNAQQVASKFLSFDSEHKQLNTSLGVVVGVDSVWAATANSNWIQESLTGALAYVADTANDGIEVLAKHGKFVFQSPVAETNDDLGNSLSVGWDQRALFRIGYFQLPAFVFLQVADQICSYRFTLY